MISYYYFMADWVKFDTKFLEIVNKKKTLHGTSGWLRTILQIEKLVAKGN